MEVTLASALNLASVSGLFYLAIQLKQEQSKLTELEAADVFSPAKLLYQLSKPNFLNKLRKRANNPEEYLLKTFVEGYTDCAEPIQSIVDQKTKLVHSLYFRDNIYLNDTISRSSRSLNVPTKDPNIKVRAPLYFFLKDPLKNYKCIIYKNLNVDASSAIEKIAELREYKMLNWFEKLLMYSSLILELVGLITRATAVFKGIQIGVSENEFGILVGQVLTAYGEIIYNSKEKTVRMEVPQYFMQDKSDIIKQIKSNMYGIGCKMGLLLFPFILTSIYLGKKTFIYVKKLKRLLMEKRLDQLWKAKCLRMQDEYKCIVCFDRPRNIIVKPCLHFSLCSLCYNQLERKNCPVCKKAIADIVEVCIT